MATPSSPTPPKNGASEQRKFPRCNVALDVAFGPCGDGGTRPPEAQLIRTVTVNLSLGGLCLYSSACYPIGTPLYCAIALPGLKGLIEARGVLAWFQKVNHGGHGYKLGMEFAELSAEHRAALERLLDRPPAAEPSRSKTLLLVDDDQELQRALKLRFESVGFRVVTASDGLEAIRKGREEHPHLIILDLMLPRLNGYEVCRLLKFDQKFQRIPIILFTARSRVEDMELGRAVGADAYVTKPFNGTDLIAKVEELLGASPAN